MTAKISTKRVCSLPLPASAIGSICGRPLGHNGYCGDPIASTPAHPERRPSPTTPTEETPA